MPEKLSIEVVKHSNKDIRVIIKSDFKTVKASLNDLCLCKFLLFDVLDVSSIFTETKTFEDIVEDQ